MIPVHTGFTGPEPAKKKIGPSYFFIRSLFFSVNIITFSMNISILPGTKMVRWMDDQAGSFDFVRCKTEQVRSLIHFLFDCSQCRKQQKI